MFVDSSALVEILTYAPRRPELIKRINEAQSRFSTNANVIYETTVVLVSRTGKSVVEARDFLMEFLDELDAEIVPITQTTAFTALDAFARYGKGRHPAKLNFGDCFSYAGAKAAGVGLLYVGDDFALTDLA